MKIYARVKKQYGKYEPKENVIVSCGFKKYCEMLNWKTLGYIAQNQVIPNDIKEYNKIKKELIEKGLIK